MAAVTIPVAAAYRTLPRRRRVVSFASLIAQSRAPETTVHTIGRWFKPEVVFGNAVARWLLRPAGRVEVSPFAVQLWAAM